jgi:hypothetical protein
MQVKHTRFLAVVVQEVLDDSDDLTLIFMQQSCTIAPESYISPFTFLS